MAWVVKRTDTFLDYLKAIRKDKTAVAELDKKIGPLAKDHFHVGSWLSGDLHGKKSTRILKITQENHSNAWQIQ